MSSPLNTFVAANISCNYPSGGDISGNLEGGRYQLIGFKGNNYATVMAMSYWTKNPILTANIENGVWKNRFIKIITDSDLGGEVFSTATGAIKYGMNGIYLGKFSNGVEQPDGTGIFDACIYLIGTKSLETAVYAFPITQYIGGHLFFNRMGTNNQFELTSWKKLI